MQVMEPCLQAHFQKWHVAMRRRSASNGSGATSAPTSCSSLFSALTTLSTWDSSLIICRALGTRATLTRGAASPPRLLGLHALLVAADAQPAKAFPAHSRAGWVATYGHCCMPKHPCAARLRARWFGSIGQGACLGQVRIMLPPHSTKHISWPGCSFQRRTSHRCVRGRSRWHFYVSGVPARAVTAPLAVLLPRRLPPLTQERRRVLFHQA